MPKFSVSCVNNLLFYNSISRKRSPRDKNFYAKSIAGTPEQKRNV